MQQHRASEKLQENRPEAPAKRERPQTTDEELSAFEKYIQERNAGTISTAISQFGYDLFQQSPDTFAPVDAVPIGPDYLLGPEDEIKISVWGKVNADYSSAIDRDGTINIPQIGIVHLAGLTFAEGKTFLEKEFSRYYKASEVKMNVSLGRLRSIRIFVVGKAQRPGSFTLSSLSTLINALFASGGPSKAGTMRNIQVKRNGTTLVHFDLYDFLLKGDKTQDIRLMPEDVIFIPPVGPLVGIAGDVKSPAIYELKEETRLEELIDMSGGFNDIAFKSRIQIDRIVDHNQQKVLEVGSDEIQEKRVQVQPGDLVKVFSVVQDQRMVRLSGAVQREGEYGISAGMTVKDLIALAGGLKYYAYAKEAELTRVTPTPEGPKTEKLLVALGRVLDGEGGADVALKENDYLFVRAVPEWELHRTVMIQGEVRFPGAYTIEKGETLSSLIERAGGFRENAYLKGAVFTRESVRELQQRQLNDSIDRLEQQILSQSAESIEASLTPEGALQQKASMEQRRLLIAKMRAAKAKGRISIVLAPLEKFKGSPSDIPLEEGDILFVPEKPRQVQVIGAVYNSTAFIYDSKATVASYIKKAGGMTENANDGQAYLLKVDGTAISKEQAGGFFGGGFTSSTLDPGDTVVIPERTERIYWLREVKDMTQILYQIAVTAGVLIVAF
ncbi:MAG: SLBB domain-containing protein [Candidatus Manganitrophus sp.]|nr:MAG: SLBB domain-containing protein [Candidatus Manganitrophus sp.]